MINALRLGLLLAAVAIVAVISCWLAGRYFPPRSGVRPVDTHAWIHRELNISAAQDNTLEPIEDRYARRRQELSEIIRQANQELARAILEDKEYSPRVTSAIEKIDRAQGELQQATLQHVFEMRPALRPEQYDTLLRSTAAALQSQTTP